MKNKPKNKNKDNLPNNVSSSSVYEKKRVKERDNPLFLEYYNVKGFVVASSIWEDPTSGVTA